MKGCRKTVEKANAGIGLNWFCHPLLEVLFEVTVLFNFETVCKLLLVSRVFDHYPMFTLHFAWLRIYDAENLIGMICNII